MKSLASWLKNLLRNSQKAYDALGSFLQASAAEFKEARQQQDGVTVKFTWKNVPGMSAIRTIINISKEIFH
jgi:hypothetical protein